MNVVLSGRGGHDLQGAARLSFRSTRRRRLNRVDDRVRRGAGGAEHVEEVRECVAWLFGRHVVGLALVLVGVGKRVSPMLRR